MTYKVGWWVIDGERWVIDGAEWVIDGAEWVIDGPPTGGAKVTHSFALRVAPMVEDEKNSALTRMGRWAKGLGFRRLPTRREGLRFTVAIGYGEHGAILALILGQEVLG
jgi:hypothetical protein